MPVASRAWRCCDTADPEARGMDDGTDARTLLLGLDGFVLLAATEHDHELVLLVETTADRVFCRECGVQAAAKGRARTLVRDVPHGDRPVVLVWWKRIWRCVEEACPAVSWRETSEAIRPRAVLTERARAWAVRRVGRDGAWRCRRGSPPAATSGAGPSRWRRWTPTRATPPRCARRCPTPPSSSITFMRSASATRSSTRSAGAPAGDPGSSWPQG